MAKQLMLDDNARRCVLDGLTKLASAVRVTMGPTGKNVLLQKSFGPPRVLEAAAQRLGVSQAELREAFGEARPPDYGAAAKRLGVNEEVLRRIMEQHVASSVPYRGHVPGCTLTPEGYLLCHPAVPRRILATAAPEH